MLMYFEKKFMLEGVSCFQKSIDSNHLYLMNTYYVPGSEYVNSVSPLSLARILWSVYYLYLHCIEEETEVQRS